MPAQQNKIIPTHPSRRDYPSVQAYASFLGKPVVGGSVQDEADNSYNQQTKTAVLKKPLLTVVPQSAVQARENLKSLRADKNLVLRLSCICAGLVVGIILGLIFINLFRLQNSGTTFFSEFATILQPVTSGQALKNFRDSVYHKLNPEFLGSVDRTTALPQEMVCLNRDENICREALAAAKNALPKAAK